MDMQDKEIDELFSSRFQDFEVEPSKSVWPGIVSRLEAGKRKKIPYLSIAASLLILLTAGIYFIAQEKADPKKTVKMVLSKNNTPVKSIIAAKPVIIKNDTQPVSPKRLLTAKIARPVKLKERDMITARERETLTAQVPDMHPAEQLTQITPKHEVITQFVVPSAEIPLSVKTEVPEEVPFITKPAQTVQIPLANKAIAAAPVKKRRIRSLGDLINVVVSKVDKRKDKVIEFTNTDDDEATITGINLGFIKIKKQD